MFIYVYLILPNIKTENQKTDDVIENWLRNRINLEYLTALEQLYNHSFKVFESEHFRKQTEQLTFTPSMLK